MDQTTELLKQLKDIELPDRSGWWIAPGWFVLAILFALAIWLGLRWLRHYRHYKKTNWRPEARAEIAMIRSDIEGDRHAKVLSSCSRLARRIAMAMDTRAGVAELTGEEWLNKLDELGHTDFFTTGAGRLLATAPYRRENPDDRTQVLEVLNALEQVIDSKSGQRP